MIGISFPTISINEKLSLEHHGRCKIYPNEPATMTAGKLKAEMGKVFLIPSSFPCHPSRNDLLEVNFTTKPQRARNSLIL
jgi:hypothetical protein